MLTLHFARHGQTIWHASNRYASDTDIPLTRVGRLQADFLAEFARSTSVQRVVASDLQRTVRTAMPAATAIGASLETDPRLREVRFGMAEGLTQAETERRMPRARAAYMRAPATTPFPGGEPAALAAERALEVVWELSTARSRARVLVVAHSAIGRVLFAALLGIPLNDYRRRFPRLDSTAVTTLVLPRNAPSAAELRGTGQLHEFNRPVDHPVLRMGPQVSPRLHDRIQALVGPGREVV